MVQLLMGGCSSCKGLAKALATCLATCLVPHVAIGLIIPVIVGGLLGGTIAIVFPYGFMFRLAWRDLNSSSEAEQPQRSTLSSCFSQPLTTLLGNFCRARTPGKP